MPLRSDWSQRPCPIARGINEIGDPWTLLILRELLSGIYRFDEIRENTEAAENILSARLKALIAKGLAVQQPYSEGRRTRFEYRPTQAALDALPVLHAFALWAEKNTPSDTPDRALTIVCRECHERSVTGESCSSCNTHFTTENVSWIRPIYANHIPRPLSGAS
ncbi:HxlR family transcriptional regulator [Glutamicibacter uratoxydans]|uniref:HxlR family transcriptional regulator n=1 Tax=Glutamicibacter uratoxydans TaxID=43667 RepID=A0A4Y4DSN3_GLUUR|nr:HxlR family transcriptional regulator [Glutamicibacter uratoxydans]